MYRIHGLFLFLLAFCLACSLTACGTFSGIEGPADLVLVHGRITTMDPALPEAQALAVAGDRVLAVGRDEDLEKFIGPSTHVIDLEGKRVVPGFIESHAHLLGLGKAASQLDLVGTTSAAEIAAMVREEAQRLPPGQWILGRGWDQNDWDETVFPTHQPLSAAAPGHPVYLTRIDGHASWINRSAMETAGLDEETIDPPGGRILRNAAGEPSGVLIDTALNLVSGKIPAMTRAMKKEAIVAGISEAQRYGITSLHDAGAGREVIALYRELLEEQRLGIRLYVMLDGTDDALLTDYFRTGPEIGLGDQRLTVRTVKLFADGALGSRGAALIDPYTDEPDHRGLLIESEDELFEHARNALAAGFQVCTHAIGDRANRITLNAYERAIRVFGNDPPDHRFRVEHAQILHPEEIPRFAELKVIPAMQPTHCTSDMPWVSVRIGDARSEEGAYVWRKLLDTGVRIPAGSDAPVESIDPLLGLYAAITRQDLEGNPPGGWYPDQRLTRFEALEGFTLSGAYAAFEESEKGRLSPGYLADLVVLSRDILSIAVQDVPAAAVEMTIVGGQVVYAK